MTKTIVVLGGSYAGVGVVQKLLKHTKNTVKDLKVILVSKVRRIDVLPLSLQALSPCRPATTNKSIYGASRSSLALSTHFEY
jgi:NADH dehydrogenase FAD-containing subunit